MGEYSRELPFPCTYGNNAVTSQQDSKLKYRQLQSLLHPTPVHVRNVYPKKSTPQKNVSHRQHVSTYNMHMCRKKRGGGVERVSQ